MLLERILRKNTLLLRNLIKIWCI